MKLSYRLSLLCLLFVSALAAQPKIQLVDFVSGITRPVDIAHHGTSDLYIVEQHGRIWLVDSLGNKNADPFLDIDPLVRSTGNEQGLLGLAFHPEYETNGYFYVCYTRHPDGDTHVSRFSRDSMDATKADPNSELVLIYADQPYSNHNGGCIKFGPDNDLYIALGDGGSGGDPQNNGQKKASFLGKILRIDVSDPDNGYTVPADNPFVGDPDFFPEIWSWGWRNPWRFSFDQLTGDMWIADVGQNAWEEIDYEPANTPGLNYAWRCYEGDHAYNPSNCLPASAFTGPAFEYPNPSMGCSVTGGFVYRGTQYSDLYGKYIFADYCSGRWWVTYDNGNDAFTTEEIADLSNFQYSTLGEDYKGELYVARLSSGRIQKITELCSGFQISSQATSAECAGSEDGQIDLDITGGEGDITIIWSNGSTGEINTDLNPGEYFYVAEDENGCVRSDTVEVEAQVTLDAPGLQVLGGGSGTICPGESLVLESTEAPADYTYVWFIDGVEQPNMQEQTFTATVPGIYEVRIQATMGTSCISDPSNSIEVAVLDVPEPQVDLVSGQEILCPGDTAVLQTATFPGYDIQWFSSGSPIPGETGSQINVFQFGEYVASLTGECGVFSSDPLLIDQEVVIPPSIGQVSDTLFATQGWAGYQWYLNDELLQGATEATLHVEEEGTYYCVFTSDNGCMYESDILVVSLGSKDPENISKLSLNPNPGTDFTVLQLELNQPERIQIALYDLSDKRLFQQSAQGKSLTKTIDLHNLPAGTYILQIETKEGTAVRKIIKN